MLRAQFIEDPDVGSVSLFQKLQGQIGDGRDLQVGRGIDSDIVLDSRRVPLLISRRHAILSRRGSRLYLQDVRSTNGTFVNDVRLGEGENRALQEGDFLSFGGAKLLRQAHRDYDEPNPFLFKLTDMHRLFTQALPSAVPDNQPATLRHSTAGEVIDLTEGDSPLAADLSAPGPSRSHKRPRRSHTAAAIILDDFDSDTDVQMLPGSREGKQSRKATPIPAPPPPPPLPPTASDKLLEAASGSAKETGSALMLKALEGQFECTICREFMVAAHSLVPCGHMFCGSCVGEWILRKQSCPTCRAPTTAAPVPSLKVDNMLEEVVAPHLDDDAKRERARRKSSWAAESPNLLKQLQAVYKRQQPPPVQHHTDTMLQHLGGLMNLHGMMELTWGHFAGNPARNQNNRRYRTARRGSGNAAHQAVPTQPMLPASVPPGPFSFGVLGRGNGRTCNACGGALIPNQVCIKEGATRAYHTHCDGNIPGFLNTWQTSGGNLPGIHLLSQNDMLRLNRHLHNDNNGPGTRRSSRR